VSGDSKNPRLILAVDTALGACSVAILSGEKLVAHRHVAMDRGHAEALAPMVHETMHAANLAFADLTRLAVTTGPGTFTGQRVGLAFMRALRVALNIPCLGVTTLAAMAAQACSVSGAAQAIAAHDARRGEIYCGVYGKDGAVLMPPTLLKASDAPGALRALPLAANCALAGTAAPILQSHLAFRDSGIAQPDAEFVARLALLMPATNAPPQPLYLRAPDAKLPLKPLAAQP
jgi:tRNA threonylcarbamoyladenosine biosynthesis protein TsaB